MTERIDYAGAVTTLERREKYLADQVFPEPGAKQSRPAHWRDEAELKALRAVLPLAREKLAGDSEDLKGLLVEVANLLDTIVESYETIDPVLFERAEALLDRVDKLDAS